MTSPKFRGASDKPCSAMEIAEGTCISTDPTKVVRESIHHRARYSGTGDRNGVIKCSVL